MKQYKSFVENNRRLAQEANAFVNGALDGEQQRMKGKGWRDKDAEPDRVKDKVERGNVTVSETDLQRQNRERKLFAAVKVIPHCYPKVCKGQQDR